MLDALAFGDFGTDIDYALDDEGELAYLYHVPLKDVQKELIEREERIVSRPLRGTFSS